MTSLSSTKLKTSYHQSVEIIKDHSKSFYQGFKQLPEEKFLAVASIYAFCRTVDDIADDSRDENKLESLKELEDIEADILPWKQLKKFPMTICGGQLLLRQWQITTFLHLAL